MSSTLTTTVDFVAVDGVNVFYRSAGPVDAPVLLLLHGYPAASYQYRTLIDRLAHKYRCIAPDLPGFGFTEVPESKKYAYTFENFGKTITAFVDALKLERFAIYMFAYGAPTGFYVAIARPERLTAIISQNGNAYEEGLGAPWGPMRKYWADPSRENRDAIRGIVSPEGLQSFYTSGVDLGKHTLDPLSWTLDAALISRPGNAEIQLDIFYDYQNNVKAYPRFQAFLRERQPPVLAVWGKNDEFFIPPGAKAFKRDVPNARVVLLDTGHFPLETHVEEIAQEIESFLDSI